MGVRVAGASETAASERATIDRGTSSTELMRRAGEGAAEEIRARYSDEARGGVVVFTGSGNNGGDGWVVAASLAASDLRVSVLESGESRTQEAIAARAAALASPKLRVSADLQDETLVIDALLGTGSAGAPRGSIADAIGFIEQRRAGGAKVIALDLPTGVDATTGEHERCVVADATISFGTLKRGHLLARDVCGEIVVLDIGLDDSDMSGLPLLVDRDWVHERVPSIPYSAHKGTRKRVSIVGGGKGMAGAAILAGEGALRSGVGLLRIVASADNAVAIHAGIPEAIVQSWPAQPEDLEHLVSGSDVIALGPGLGKSGATRELVEQVLIAWSGPVVLDADALNVFAGDTRALNQLLARRPAVITPHPAELGRLIGVSTEDVLAERFDIGGRIAADIGAAVLLKGTPTVVSSVSGARYVSGAGTPALATGGSGDVLTGMVATLLAQMCGGSSDVARLDDRCAEAAACAAFVHGRAAELCGHVRGTTLRDVLQALPSAWNEAAEVNRSGVLARIRSH